MSINSLKKKLVKQSKANQAHNYQIRIQNVKYMEEIQQLRKELKLLTQIGADQKKQPVATAPTDHHETQALQSEIGRQNAEIMGLRNEIQMLHNTKNMKAMGIDDGM